MTPKSRKSAILIGTLEFLCTNDPSSPTNGIVVHTAVPATVRNYFVHMDTDNDTPLLTVACRFVPYDQWLITHLDTSWHINQVKLWFLSKCNLLAGSRNNVQSADLDLPRYRPISPITFATGSLRPGGSLDSGDSGDGIGSDYEGSETGSESAGRSSYESFEYAYSYGRKGRRPTTSNRHSQKPSISGGEVRPQQQKESERTLEEKTTASLASLYSLVTFSTGNILEDEFPISWYKLRPYELLEMHFAGSIVTLPREIMMEYIKPYFEAKVKSLRVVWKVGEGGMGAGTLGGGNSYGDGTGKKMHKGRRGRSRSMDPLNSAGPDRLSRADTTANGKDKKSKKNRTQLEWKDRWVVIHQGVLNLCRHRMDPVPTHRISLSSLLTLRGAEHLTRGIPNSNSNSSKTWPNTLNTASPTSSSAYTGAGAWVDANTGMDMEENTDEFVICAKFKFKSKEKDLMVEADRLTGKSMKLGSSPLSAVVDDEPWRSKDQTNGDSADGEWIILDMLEQNAFSSILRIIHRHSPLAFASSFLPNLSTVNPDFATTTTTPTPTPNASKLSLSHSPSSSTPASLIIPPTSVSAASTSTSPTPTSPTPTQNSMSHLLSIVSLLNSSTPLTARSSFATTTAEGTSVMMGLRSLGTIPYPEWRMRMVNKARRAGLGDLGKAMEWVLKGKIQPSEAAEWRSFPNSEYDGAEIANDQAVDIDHDDEGSEDMSDVEWEGWTIDLERQSRIRQSKNAEKRQQEQLNDKTDDEAAAGCVPLPSSPLLSSSSDSEPSYKPRAFASTFDPPLSPGSPTVSDYGAHHSQYYHPYTFAQSMPSSMTSSWDGESDGTTIIPPMPILRMKNTITSTVSVGNTAPSPATTRRRSSTVTVTSGMGSRLLRKKDKDKETETELARVKAKNEEEKQRVIERVRQREREKRRAMEKAEEKEEKQDNKSTIKASMSKGGKKPKLALAFSAPSASSTTHASPPPANLGNHHSIQSTEGIVSDPPPFALIHVRSSSTLQQENIMKEMAGSDAESLSPLPSAISANLNEAAATGGASSTSTSAATGGSRGGGGGTKRMRLGKGVSLQGPETI